jgi:hypothetical protein
MGLKRFVGLGIVGILLFSLTSPVFSATKQELRDQLSQARKDFIAQRDDLHDQDRVLRVAWHKERAELYQQAKENPSDATIRAKITEGARKFFADKKAVYEQLEQLRKDWLETRRELGEAIKRAQ